MSHTLGAPQHPHTLAKVIARRATCDPSTVLRTYGVVVSVQTGPPRTLTITMNGDPTLLPGIRFRAGYNNGIAPAPGDVVVIDVVGRDHIVVDVLAT